MTSTHFQSSFYLNGLKDRSPPQKVLNYESSTTFSEDLSKLKQSTSFFKIIDNNNLDLYRKFVSKTIESQKYFNYYDPRQFTNQSRTDPNLQNVNLDTVMGLEKKYDLEDGLTYDIYNEEESQT
jgi:hypothetical protein